MVHIQFEEGISAEIIGEICEGLSGWKPYVNNEVVVHDTIIEADNTTVTKKCGIIIGPDNGKDLTINVKLV